MRRDVVDRLPGVADLDASVEDGLHEQIPLTNAHPRRQPAQHAAERDHADPISLFEVEVRQSDRRAQRPIDRIAVGPERVQKEDDVAVALGTVVIHLQRAAPPGRVPVDVPHPVTRDKLTDLREFDAIAAGPRHLVARIDLGLRRPDDGPQDFGARVDPNRQRLIHRSLLRVQPQGIAPP